MRPVVSIAIVFLASRVVLASFSIDDESPPDGCPLLSKKLAETGGILMPPEHGRLIIINPPDTGPNSMPTRPDIRPRARSGEASMPSVCKGESGSVDPGQM
jgi:hypothetical protein